MLNSHEPDPCCGTAISKALLDGKLDGHASWNCSDCGTLWRPRIMEGIIHWEPHPFMLIVPVR